MLTSFLSLGLNTSASTPSPVTSPLRYQHHHHTQNGHQQEPYHQDDRVPPLIPPYTEMPRELDIPPDDISAEDTKYGEDSPLVNVDELPPPPEELLMDNYVKPSSCSSLPRPACDSTSEPFSGKLIDMNYYVNYCRDIDVGVM